MNYKEKYLHLLGSKVFPDILEASILDPLMFNKLIVAHIAALTSQCKGIKEGHCYMEYVTSSEERFTENVIGPKLCFSLYTNKDKLIEHTNRSSRASNRITSTNDFSYSDFRDPLTLRRFLLAQQLKMKHLPGHDWESVADQKIKIEYKKPLKAEQIDYFYEQIIASHKDIESFLNHYFLKSDLPHENTVNTKKMKL
jgi:hypothetical protein